MALSLVTGPLTEPVTLAEAKRHLRVEVDDDNGLIASLITAARQYVETYTHRALVAQTWDLKLDGFPSSVEDSLWLPFPPVSSVTSVTYVATDGTSTTWTASLYTTDLPFGPMARAGRLVPAYGESYPTTRGVINAVTVRFVCGYTAVALPESLRAGLKLLIAHWYDQRNPINVGHVVSEIPRTIDALLWPYKSFGS